jgi:hypothetical protein
MESFGVSRVELEAMKIGLQQRLSVELLGAGVETSYDALTQSVIFALRGFVWAEKESVRHQEAKYPRDWWQALKERWFPKWLLDKYPVDYHVITIDVKAIYPTFKQAIPSYESRLIIQRYDDFSSNYWKDGND